MINDNRLNKPLGQVAWQLRVVDVLDSSRLLQTVALELFLLLIVEQSQEELVVVCVSLWLWQLQVIVMVGGKRGCPGEVSIYLEGWLIGQIRRFDLVVDKASHDFAPGRALLQIRIQAGLSVINRCLVCLGDILFIILKNSSVPILLDDFLGDYDIVMVVKPT